MNISVKSSELHKLPEILKKIFPDLTEKEIREQIVITHVATTVDGVKPYGISDTLKDMETYGMNEHK